MFKALSILCLLFTSALPAQFAGGTLGGKFDGFPGKKWGVVNRDGKVVVPFQFISLEVSANGAMLVRNAQGKFAILKPDGQPSTGFEFDRGYPMAGEVIVVLKGQLKGVFSSAGEPLLPTEFQDVWTPGHDLIPAKQRDKWGWFDTRNRSFHFPDGHYDFMEVLGEDLVVGIEKERQRGTGFHRGGSQRWEMAISDWPIPLDDSHFSAKRGSSSHVYDHDGNESTFPRQGKASVATFSEGGRFGLKDSEGRIAVPPKYDHLIRSGNGLSRAWTRGEGMTLIRDTGEAVTSRTYHTITEPGADGRFLALETSGSKRWVFLDASGRVEPFPGEYSEVHPALSSGLIPAREP